VESSVKWDLTRRSYGDTHEEIADLADALADGWAPFAVTQVGSLPATIWLRRPVR
jgi:hypothetical protein